MDVRLTPVVDEADRNRQRFAAFCTSLSPGELSAPVPASTWDAQDYIAHLASIDIWVADWFEHQAEGRRWRPKGDDGGPFDIDTWNEARIIERRGRTVQELLEEAAGHRDRLWQAVGRFTPEVLDARFDFRGHNITFLRYLQLWAGHDPAHAAADMVRAIPGRAAELHDWFAEYRLDVSSREPS